MQVRYILLGHRHTKVYGVRDRYHWIRYGKPEGTSLRNISDRISPCLIDCSLSQVTLED